MNSINQEIFIPKKNFSDAPFTFNEYLNREFVKLDERIDKQNLMDSATMEETQYEPDKEKPIFRININKLVQAYLIEYIRNIYNEA